MPTTKDLNVIQAEPTKDFFINMITRDIELIPAIIDLVDNSVDGARRVRGSNGDFRGLWVRLEVDSDHFRIADNCGGIPVGLARNYAFRFGRPADMPPTPHSTGQFGVGMKRALFKMGKKFRIESTTNTSQFEVIIDVDEWRQRDAWEFEFAQRREDLPEIHVDKRGTIIEVEPLLDTVAKSFALENFRTRLARELAETHQETIGRGLAVTLNRVPVQVDLPTLLQSDHLKPAHRKFPYKEAGHPEVTVEIYAGVAESDPSRAGWYVFCNGRLILGADQSSVTGWGEGSATTNPRYHPQFAMFRGFVFFDSDDGTLLPWNTTKTGMDLDSGIYQAAKLVMLNVMRPVIDFLNRLKEEKDREPEERPLQELVEDAKGAPLKELEISPNFETIKTPKPPTLPLVGNILYRKPLVEIERVKKALKVQTNKEVGEKTFEFFLRTEVDSE